MIREDGGWSAIISPMGRIIAGPHRDTETILVADLDFTEIAMFKCVADSVGHYARPDVFQLAMNFGPQPVAVPMAAADTTTFDRKT